MDVYFNAISFTGNSSYWSKSQFLWKGVYDSGSILVFNLKTEKVKVIFFQSSMLLDSIGTLNILALFFLLYQIDSNFHWLFFKIALTSEYSALPCNWNRNSPNMKYWLLLNHVLSYVTCRHVIITTWNGEYRVYFCFLLRPIDISSFVTYMKGPHRV